MEGGTPLRWRRRQRRQQQQQQQRTEKGARARQRHSEGGKGGNDGARERQRGSEAAGRTAGQTTEGGAGAWREAHHCRSRSRRPRTTSEATTCRQGGGAAARVGDRAGVPSPGCCRAERLQNKTKMQCCAASQERGRAAPPPRHRPVGAGVARGARWTREWVPGRALQLPDVVPQHLRSGRVRRGRRDGTAAAAGAARALHDI